MYRIYAYFMTQKDLNQKMLNQNASLERDEQTIHQARFFHTSLDLLCVLNSDGEILSANRSFETVFGLTPLAINGRLLGDLVYSPEYGELTTSLKNLKSLTTPMSFECRFRGLDDSEKWYLWTIYPQESVFNAVGRDLTPYKEMGDKELERNIFAEALLDTVLAINTSLSLEQVLERILSNIGKVVAYDYVNIFLIDGNMAEIVGSQSRTPHSIDVNLNQRQQFPVQNHEYLHSMLRNRESIIIPHIVEAPIWMDLSGAKHHSGSFLGTPIEVENSIIGFIGVFNTQKDFFTPLHARQVTTFANHIGIAIVNARLYEQSQSAAILRERQRVAQELHDSVNQELFAASTYADLLIKAINRKPELIQQYATNISQLIRGAVEQMRMILIELHPDTLTQTTLPLLIQQLSESFSNRTGIPVDFDSNTSVILQAKEQIAVYRIAQEILHNIEKHADAKRVSVHIHQSDTYFEVKIADDGIGFDSKHLTEFQFGIRGMQERAESIGATVFIDSHNKQGTIVTFRRDY